MANLISVSSIETKVSGQYNTTDYVFNVNYTYAKGKVTNMNMQITKVTDNSYAGNANYSSNGTLSVSVVDSSILGNVSSIISQLYAEAVSTAAANQ